MYAKIIVGHDLHEGGDDALALAQLVSKATGAKLVVAGVFPIGDLPHGFEPQWREEEERIAREIQATADRAGAEAEAFPSSSPARGLGDLAKELGADLLVVGSSRHSKLGQILAGNVGLGLLESSPCPLAIAPRGYGERRPDALERITVGFDGSHEAGLALANAVELARRGAAELELIAVVEPDRAGDRLLEQLDEAAASIPEGIHVNARLLTGEPAAKLAEAGAGTSLLVLGSRAHGPLRRVLLGSVSSALVRSAPCPLVVHPRGSDAQLAGVRSAKRGEAE